MTNKHQLLSSRDHVPKLHPMQILRHCRWIVLWGLAIVLLLYPINCRFVRVSLLLVLLAASASTLWVFWNRKTFRQTFIGILFLVGGFLACPGRTADPHKLRDAYLAVLRSYEGTRYLWGGENRFGIDCSGLVRAGLIKANFQTGLYTLNPRLVRLSLSLWWHDCSARELGAEYRGQTRHILSAPSINALDESLIQPGDLAVTASGVHVLAFLGNQKWIEADPHYQRVVIVPVPDAKNPWFKEPVLITRWTELAQ